MFTFVQTILSMANLPIIVDDFTKLKNVVIVKLKLSHGSRYVYRSSNGVLDIGNYFFFIVYTNLFGIS